MTLGLQGGPDPHQPAAKPEAAVAARSLRRLPDRALLALALLPILAGAAGMVAFLRNDGEAVGLGEWLLAAAAGCAAVAALCAWQTPRRWRLAAGLLAPALVFLLFGLYACWVAGLEGQCVLLG